MQSKIEIEINPAGIKDEYLRCINFCFGNWGDSKTYSWAFEQEIGAPKSDLMVLRKDGRLLAGSAVTYRKIALPNNKVIMAGIMDGSWTLPEARGQGCFSRIIQESIYLTKQKGGALLLGCGKVENVSYRRLAAAGFALFPAYYLISTPDTPLSDQPMEFTPISATETVLKEIIGRLESIQKNKIHFFYPTLNDWKSQFLNRPVPAELLAIGDYGWCAIEKAETTDCLQMIVLKDCGNVELKDCIAGLLKKSIDCGRKLFLYTASAELCHECEQLGFRAIPGCIYALVTDPSQLKDILGIKESWNFADSVQLADSHSRWFLGNWDIQSGDRV